MKGFVMKDSIKSRAIAVKNHVARNKVAYVAGTIAILAVALQQRNRIAFYKFLEEEGIDPMKFYCPEFYAELHP